MNHIVRIALSILLFAFILACLTGCNDDNECYDTSTGKLCVSDNGSLQAIDNTPQLPSIQWPDYQDTSNCEPIQGPFCK